MSTLTATAPRPEFGAAAAVFRQVIAAPRIRVAERVQALPLTMVLATALGAIK